MKRLGFIVAFGASLRALWVVYAARIPEYIHDPVRYLLHAIDLAEGRGYRHLADGSPTAYSPIGYPLILSLLYRVVGLFHDPPHAPVHDLAEAAFTRSLASHAEEIGHLVTAALWLNVLLSTATIVLAYRIARRLGGATAGILAAAGVACFPNLVFHTGTLLTETTFVFLSLAALAVLLECNDLESTSPDPRRAAISRLALAGALLGAAALVRPIILAILPCIPAALLLGRIGFRRAALASAVVTVACVAVVLPWSVRNWVVMDAPVLVSTNTGDNLCIGHHPGAPGKFVMPAKPCPTPYAAHLRMGTYAEVRRNADRQDQALRYALAHPRAEIALLAKKLYYLFLHDHSGLEGVESYRNDRFLDPSLRSSLERVADFYFFAVLLLGAGGFALLLWPPWQARHLVFASAALVFTTVPLLFFGDPRFHVPLSPLLAIAGAVLVSRIASARRTRRTPRPESSVRCTCNS